MARDAVLALLVGAGPPLSIFEAAMVDYDDVRQLVVSDHLLATTYSDEGCTALHLAAYFGATRTINVLLEYGARIEAVTYNHMAGMPLHAAAAGGRTESCKLLLRHGADPNAKQHSGFTPLMTAAFNNNRELVEMLIARNANFDVRNDDGKTAADVAAGLGNMEIAARLRLGEQVIDRRTESQTSPAPEGHTPLGRMEEQSPGRRPWCVVRSRRTMCIACQSALASSCSSISSCACDASRDVVCSNGWPSAPLPAGWSPFAQHVGAT